MDARQNLPNHQQPYEVTLDPNQWPYQPINDSDMEDYYIEERQFEFGLQVITSLAADNPSYPARTCHDLSSMAGPPPEIHVREATFRETEQDQTQHPPVPLQIITPMSSTPSSPNVTSSVASSCGWSSKGSPYLQPNTSSPSSSSPFPGQRSPVIAADRARRGSNYASSPLGKRMDRGDHQDEDAIEEHDKEEDGTSNNGENSPAVKTERWNKKQKVDPENAELDEFRVGCPFSKRGMKVTRNSCTGQGFCGMDRLKEHMERAHSTKFVCDLCHQNLDNAAAFKKHQDEINCISSTHPYPDDVISDKKLAMIKAETKKRKEKFSPKEKWDRIWKILFGDVPAPDPHPDVISFHVIRMEFPEALTSQLVSSGVITENNANFHNQILTAARRALHQVGVSHGILSDPLTQEFLSPCSPLAVPLQGSPYLGSALGIHTPFDVGFRHPTPDGNICSAPPLEGPMSFDSEDCFNRNYSI